MKYRSVKQLKFAGQNHFMHLVWAVLILVSVMAYPQLMLFVTCFGVIRGSLTWSADPPVSGRRHLREGYLFLVLAIDPCDQSFESGDTGTRTCVSRVVETVTALQPFSNKPELTYTKQITNNIN